MKRILSSILGLAALAFAQGAGAAPITMTVVASSAPNAFGSPSFAGYAANALNSLENGLGNIGDRNTSPTAYEILGGTFQPGDMMVTSYPSWRGVANPAAPFGSELGNRIHFGLHITGDGTVQFKLNDLTFELLSSDGALDFVGDFIGFDFNGTTRYGIDWGADNAKGGGDDTIVAGAGSGLVLVDELVYVGVGNGYWPGGDDPDPSNPLLGRQGALDDVSAYILGNKIVFSGSYCITGTDDVEYCAGERLVTENRVPEPASLMLVAAGFVAGGLLARRRRG